MRNRSIRISIFSLIIACFAAFTMAFLMNGMVAKADDIGLEFENGAYVKNNDDSDNGGTNGGMRFRIKIDSDKAAAFQGESPTKTIYVYVGSTSNIGNVADQEECETLYTNNNAWRISVASDKIYAGKYYDENEGQFVSDGYYYANVLLDINTLGKTIKDAYWTTEFTAVATVYDGSSYSDLIKSPSRSLQYVASVGALSGGNYKEITTVYDWLGSESKYAMLASNRYDYEALEGKLAELDSDKRPYFFLNDVEDTKGLISTYSGKGSISQKTITFDTDGGSSIGATEYNYGTVTSTLTLPEATKVGSDFLCWTLSDGNPLPATITGNITVKAVWGTYTTLYIDDEEDFLDMGTTLAGYHEKQWKYITFELTTDLTFDTDDFDYHFYGDPDFVGFAGETPKTGYLVRNLDCAFDGKGYTITTDYDKYTDYDANTSSSGFTVMFNEIGVNGKLRNLKVVATTDSGWGASSVTKANRGLIENCCITASHTYSNGWASGQCFSSTAEIIYNYGTVRNCVFNFNKTYHTGNTGEVVYGLTNYAVRNSFENGKIENCTIIGNSGHNISSNQVDWDKAVNSDDATKRINCYVFASVSDLLSGNGYKYNANGTVTKGTYDDAKNNYTDPCWTDWGFVNPTPTVIEIDDVEDFLGMGDTLAEYPEEERPFISFALTKNLTFSTANFHYNYQGDPDFFGFAETPKTGYLVRNLDCVFDGQGHTITTDYQKGTDWDATGSSSGFTVMFREIGANGVLRNLKVVATTDSGWGASSVTYVNRGLIENCYITASHTYQYGWEEAWMCFCNTAEIIYNYGTVSNCVFNLYTCYTANGATGLTNYAVRYSFAGGSIKDCTVIGNSGHNISSNNINWDTATKSDDKRDNCYVFASVSDLLNTGTGYKYNADGSVTAGTYAGVKDLYDRTHWTAWGLVA